MQCCNYLATGPTWALKTIWEKRPSRESCHQHWKLFSIPVFDRQMEKMFHHKILASLLIIHCWPLQGRSLIHLNSCNPQKRALLFQTTTMPLNRSACTIRKVNSFFKHNFNSFNLLFFFCRWGGKDFTRMWSFVAFEYFNETPISA